MNHSDILASLRKLAILIPSFAPDFNQQDVAEAWVGAIESMGWSDDQFRTVFRNAVERCKTFPSIAELRELASGRAILPDKALAQKLSEGIWNRISRVSPYYSPQEFFNGLSEPQKAALGSPEACRGLGDLQNSDRTTIVAQWRTIIEGYLQSRTDTSDVIKLRSAASERTEQVLLRQAPSLARLDS